MFAIEGAIVVKHRVVSKYIERRRFKARIVTHVDLQIVHGCARPIAEIVQNEEAGHRLVDSQRDTNLCCLT